MLKKNTSEENSISTSPPIYSDLLQRYGDEGFVKFVTRIDRYTYPTMQTVETNPGNVKTLHAIEATLKNSGSVHQLIVLLTITEKNYN